MTREENIQKIMGAFNLPKALAEQVVNEAGEVDQGRLQLIQAGIAWGKSPAANAAPGLARALSDAYYQAEAKKDAGAMIRLVDSLHRIGAQLLPKKGA